MKTLFLQKVSTQWSFWKLFLSWRQQCVAQTQHSCFKMTKDLFPQILSSSFLHNVTYTICFTIPFQNIFKFNMQVSERSESTNPHNPAPMHISFLHENIKQSRTNTNTNTNIKQGEILSIFSSLYRLCFPFWFYFSNPYYSRFLSISLNIPSISHLLRASKIWDSCKLIKI